MFYPIMFCPSYDEKSERQQYLWTVVSSFTATPEEQEAWKLIFREEVVHHFNKILRDEQFRKENLFDPERAKEMAEIYREDAKKFRNGYGHFNSLQERLDRAHRDELKATQLEQMVGFTYREKDPDVLLKGYLKG